MSGLTSLHFKPLPLALFAEHAASQYSCTFSLDHQFSLSPFLCPEDTPNTFLAVLLTTFAVLLPKACLSFSLNPGQHSSFFSFHHLILASALTRFLVLIYKAILQTTNPFPLATVFHVPFLLALFAASA